MRERRRELIRNAKWIVRLTFYCIVSKVTDT